MNDKQISILAELSEKFVNSQSFEFSSFSEARTRLSIGDYTVLYDRLSLVTIEHNLSPEEYAYFSKLIRRLCFDNFSDEELKRLSEFGVLYCFSLIIPDITTLHIKQTLHPDFELSDENGMYGIEVTELTEPSDKILWKIVSETQTDDMSVEQLKSAAIKKHGQKAFQYTYYEIGNKPFVASPLVYIDERKEIYADQIIRKYKKYITKLNDYDQFIILCDARWGIEFDKYFDVEVIFNIIDDKIVFHNVTVVVLFKDNCGKFKYVIKKWD